MKKVILYLSGFVPWILAGILAQITIKDWDGSFLSYANASFLIVFLLVQAGFAFANRK
jgi:hypothetical protein